MLFVTRALAPHEYSCRVLDDRVNMLEPSGPLGSHHAGAEDDRRRSEGLDEDMQAFGDEGVECSGNAHDEDVPTPRQHVDGIVAIDGDSQPPTAPPDWWDRVTHTVRHSTLRFGVRVEAAITH